MQKITKEEKVMPNIFLSHSSSDKERYVRIVADQLQKHLDEHSIYYDEYTFESGMKSMEEIGKSLKGTDLFVVFLSRKALESEWVKKELMISKELLGKEVIKRIYPIVIEADLKWDDKDIPDWIKDYNLKYIPKPTKATQLIRKRIVDIAWQLNPKIEKRNNIFVGRNKEINEFEERKYDYSKDTVLAYIAAGLPKIGRKSLLRHCFVKANIIEKNDQTSLIELGMYEGIEDLIIFINDLGFSEKIDITGFMKKKIPDKCKILASLLDDIAINHETIIIEDKGCIITHDGIICDWFIESLRMMKEKNRTVLGIASKFRIRVPIRDEEIFIVNVPPLNKMECGGLLQKYLLLEEITLSKEAYKNYIGMLHGFPEQVKFACSLIIKYGEERAYDFSAEIENYDSEMISQVLQGLSDIEGGIDFLRFLAEIDMVSYQSLQTILKNETFVKEKINQFYINGIIEFVGIAKEYIKINSSIKDYITRGEYELSDEYKDKLNEYVVDFLDKYQYEELEIPDYLFKLKQSLLKNHAIDNKYMIPSQYLKTMVELYEKQKDYAKVIDYADTVLKSTDYIEEKLLFEIKYFLCMALAKRRDRRMLTEVQDISGADHEFLLGFYYRMTGNYEKALLKLEHSLELRTNFSKAKREKVQVLINLEKFEDALSVAKENYENDRSNPYHIHAYFLCLIKNNEIDKKVEILNELINNLEKATSDFGKELKGRCYALYEGYVNKDSEMAFAIIDKTIAESSNPIYALQDKFDICERLHELDEMKKVIDQISRVKMRDSYGKERALYRSKLLYAAYRKDEDKIKELQNEIKNRNVRVTMDILERKIERIIND